ncbi:hypothetical protein G1K97_12405 [Tenacibaculum finnmarkense]|uniref:hypothetical protein n=1 Tax=Tenacibaculum finnmarkense TaxID=2781243 RepID=UPI001EFBF4CB|nr:hypothetical protein [Tenacibaculum finnmarkense]MCG8849527.1 hypothetical protein [Tenacibaculum finnmarkense]MCG8894435.1 hypothetical protein [Tenacibaculum finnmarkense]MCG8902636.1 hypothetical protein [Tenacibaculum finnmarkense]
MGPNEKKFNSIPNEIKRYNLTKSVKHYLYFQRSEQEIMEVYINGIPFKKYSEQNNSAVSFPINQYILKSGTQKVDVVFKSLKGKPFRMGFGGIIKIKKVAKSEDYKNNKIIKEYKTPIVDNNGVKQFIATGQLEYRDSFTFEATVPYEFTGWNESQDLSEMDVDVLEKEVVNFHENVIDIAKRKDREALFQLFYQSEFQKAESEYYDDELFKRFTGGYNFILEDPTVKFLPLKNYKLQLYTNSKIVTLESTEKYGSYALRFDYQETDDTGEVYNETSYIKILLHKPKGSDKLVPIR